MLQQINFFECMGVLFTAILAILFGFVIWGFFKVRAEMKKLVTDLNKKDLPPVSRQEGNILVKEKGGEQ